MTENALDHVDPREVGERLAAARKAKGWTQQEAAGAIGVARTTLTAIEKGQRRIQARELVRLARAYGRQVNELLLQQPLRQFAPQLRAAAGIQPDDPALAEAIAEFRALCQDYVYLEDLCEAPLVQRYPEPFDRTGLPIEDAAQTLAAMERNRLGLGDGPVLGLRQILEGDIGLRIFLMPLPSRVSAMYEYDQRAGACIALNRGHPPERRRWSEAHDYCHFLTSRYEAEVTVHRPGGRVPDNERFADAFARHFLMPEAGLRRHFLSLTRGTQTTVRELLLLAHRYGVSVEAMTRRLEDLRLVREGAWERLRREGLKVRDAQAVLGLAPQADGDDLPPLQSRVTLPVRYRYLAATAYGQGLITEAQLARLLRTDIVDARETVGMLKTQTDLAPDGEALASAEWELDVRLAG